MASHGERKPFERNPNVPQDYTEERVSFHGSTKLPVMIRSTNLAIERRVVKDQTLIYYRLICGFIVRSIQLKPYLIVVSARHKHRLGRMLLSPSAPIHTSNVTPQQRTKSTPRTGPSCSSNRSMRVPIR